METDPDEAPQGYDHEAEERAYEQEPGAGDQDAGPAGTPDEEQPSQAEG